MKITTHRDSLPAPHGASGLGRAWRVAATVLVGACAVLAGLMRRPAALGFQRYVITGKSMLKFSSKTRTVQATPHGGHASAQRVTITLTR